MNILLLFAILILSILSIYGSLSNCMSSYEEYPVEMKNRVMHNIEEEKQIPLEQQT